MADGADAVLPAFELDCRDWFVLGPGDAGVPTEIAGAPVLALLSTPLIADGVADGIAGGIAGGIHEAKGALTVGYLDDVEQLCTRDVGTGSTVLEVVDADASPGTRRYLMPAPSRGHLALLAEFLVPLDSSGPELDARVERLMASFRWQLEE